MRRQVRRESQGVCLLDPFVSGSCTVSIHPRNVGGGGNTVHPHHRVGHDGQDQVFSTQHAVLVLGEVLPVSIDGDQDPPPSATAKSHVQWYVQTSFCAAYYGICEEKAKCLQIDCRSFCLEYIK